MVALFARNRLATDEDGYVEFALTNGSSCDMYNDSKVLVAPDAGTALGFQAGKFWCIKKPGGSQEYAVPGGTIRAENPVFSVEIDGDQAVVKVTYGSLTVKSANGATERLVPALQLPLRADGTFASGPQAIELTTADRATADRLQKRLAPITAPPPKTGSSDALRTIVDAKKLTVAVDSTDQAAVAFSEAFAKALAAAWGVDVEVVQR